MVVGSELAAWSWAPPDCVHLRSFTYWNKDTPWGGWCDPTGVGPFLGRQRWMVIVVPAGARNGGSNGRDASVERRP
jgi:hypothetical protein